MPSQTKIFSQISLSPLPQDYPFLAYQQNYPAVSDQSHPKSEEAGIEEVKLSGLVVSGDFSSNSRILMESSGSQDQKESSGPGSHSKGGDDNDDNDDYGDPDDHSEKKDGDDDGDDGNDDKIGDYEEDSKEMNQDNEESYQIVGGSGSEEAGKEEAYYGEGKPEEVALEIYADEENQETTQETTQETLSSLLEEKPITEYEETIEAPSPLEDQSEVPIEEEEDSQQPPPSPYENSEEFLTEEQLLSSPNSSCSNASNFHFPNGTCSPYCPLGTYIVQYNTQYNYSTCTQCSSNCKTCSSDPNCCTSCPLDSPYLHEKNDTCLVSCPSWTIVKEDENGTKLCVVDKNRRPELPPSQQAFVQFVDNCNTVSGTLATVTMACHQIVNPGASAIPSIILLVNLLDYMKYINVTFPPKLDSMFNSQLSDFLSFQIPFSFPESLEDSNHTTRVPVRFRRYSVNSLFIVNMWAELLTSAIIFGLACAIGLITLTIGTRTLVGKVLFWLQDFFMWNYMLVYWLSILNDIVLFAIVEYQNLNLNTTLAKVSLVMNLVLFIGSLLFLSFIYYKLHQMRNKKTYGSFEDKVKSNSKIKVLFEDFKTFYFTQELMIVISSVKVIFYAIIVAAFDAPVLQIVLLILLNLATISYLLIIRPFKTNCRNIELAVYETLTLMANCACLKLALTSKADQELDVTTGDAIIITNFILISAVFLFQIISRGIQIRAYYKAKRAKQQVQPVAGTAVTTITTLTSAESTPKAGSEGIKEKLEREVKEGVKEVEGEDQAQERRNFRRRTLGNMSTVVSLSENVKTIYIRTNTIMIQENEMNP